MRGRMRDVEDVCRDIRKDIVEVCHRREGGHIGSSLSVVEILYALYFDVLRIDPRNPADPLRDRFILSTCQGALAYYSVLSRRGFFPRGWLDGFLGKDSPLTMFPTVHRIPGVDMTGGSLGHGIAFGVGLCLYRRRLEQDWRVYVLVGDGEFDEGTMWEALLAAKHLHLDPLTIVVNRNRVQIDGPTEAVMGLEPFRQKLESFGCFVSEVNGHDVAALADALRRPRPRGMPHVLLADTTKGKGVSFMENNYEWHYRIPTEAELEAARRELDGRTVAPVGASAAP